MANFGRLDQRVSLQHRTLTDDGAGGGTETWTEYAEVWANVRPMSGRERQNAMRAEASSNYVIVIRHRSDVLESDKVVWRDRDLNIRFVKSEGPRPLYLEMEAELGAQA